ncbi:MAG: tryptophan 7-halogenase [Alphaproteobacteria bacterium]|nr:tryptophan 7-halogenase [Alphaproteobacteria bacterium]
MTLPDQVDVLVIGAGPAGTASAALLAQAGVSCAVVEKQRFPRFVIGESLLPRSMETLEEAGLLEAVRARGYQVKRGATFLRGTDRCGFDFGDAYTPGWTWTWQVPRADFDHTLAKAVEARGVPVAWEHEVTALQAPPEGYDPARDAPGPVVTLKGPEGTREIAARWVVDASGWGRVLPRLLGLEVPSGQPSRRARFTHVAGDLRPPGDEGGRIWVCLHPGGAWIWIIPFADGTTSIGVVAPEAFWEALPDDPEASLRAALDGDANARARLAGTRFLWPPRELRGYSAAVQRVWGPGYHLVGNATEFLDPVFSSGVTLALESARMSVPVLLDALQGRSADWEGRYARPLDEGVDVFRTYVDTWYDGSLPEVFFADDGDDEARFRPQICSVLAGYVWDHTNPFVRHHRRRLRQAHRMVVRRAAEGASAP